MTSLENVTAVILAGGLGTRLRSVLADRPKVMADVGGRPFLTYLLDQVASANIRRTVLCTGYRAEQIRDVLKNSYNGIQLIYSEEPAPLGTAGALRLAYPLLDASTVLVMNGDSCCPTDLGEFAAWHEQHRAEASILLTQVDDARRFGRIDTDATGRILRFCEKTEVPGPGWINAGIYLLAARMLLPLPELTPLSLEREVFPKWIGRRFFGCHVQAPFMDIGTPESYAGAAAFLKGMNRVPLAA